MSFWAVTGFAFMMVLTDESSSCPSRIALRRSPSVTRPTKRVPSLTTSATPSPLASITFSTALMFASGVTRTLSNARDTGSASSFTLEKLFQGDELDAGAEEGPTLGAVERPAPGDAHDLEEDLPIPVVRGVADPGLPGMRVPDVDERLPDPVPQQIEQLVVRLRVEGRRARGVAEV